MPGKLYAHYRQLLERFRQIFCKGFTETPDDAGAPCRDLLSQHEDDRRLADLLEQQYPSCQCEQYRVGNGSPGRVENDELLHRIIASPRDYDPATGTIRAPPFEKVFSNGLSVWRAQGPQEDISTLLEEALAQSASEPPKQIFAICEASTGEIRGMRLVNGDRLFCVYDQTVRRADPDAPPVATHASVFLRLPPAGTADRKKLQKDYAGQLRERFIAGTIAAADYRGGLCTTLHSRAAEGKFVQEGSG
jgi:hypothetical protein